MKKILKVDDPNVYARYVGAPELHPLVSLISYDEVSPFHNSLNNYGVYGLFIQQQFPDNLSYGMKPLRVADASIIAVAPGQIGGGEDQGEMLSINGWALLWSPEILHGTPLEDRIEKYPFFSYFATDALQMQPQEWERLSRLLVNLRREMQENPDSPALREIIVGHLQLLLAYCNRIWQRQQQEKEKPSDDDILKRFQRLLADYYARGRQFEQGVPRVKDCAAALAYSPRYFGDLVHQTTGGTAIGYIHEFVVNQGKTLLMKGYNVSETAYLLGFEYPQHFSRLFRKVTGQSPSAFQRK